MLIEVFSDVICPWCFIGKRRLDQVLSDGDFGDVAVRWRAYQLYPSLPEEGIERATLKRGAPAGARERLLEEARREGLELKLPARLPNTRMAHELLQLAADDYGLPTQHALAEALFEGYFLEQQDLGDSAVLAQLGAGVGMAQAHSLEYLAAGSGTAAVRAELERAGALEVSGVPALLIAGRFALPGAQSTDTLRHVLARARTLLSEEQQEQQDGEEGPGADGNSSGEADA